MLNTTDPILIQKIEDRKLYLHIIGLIQSIPIDERIGKGGVRNDK